MKTYQATFWRYNPQLPHGGYTTTRILEADSLKSAEKKAKEQAADVRYGSLDLIKVEEA